MLEASSPDEIPQSLDLGSKHFGCLLVWDATEASADDIHRVAEPLIAAGCVYFVCWGLSCERVHDTIDELDPYFESTGAVVMTTWHDKEPLEETTWFFLNTMWPDPAFETSLKASLAVVIGSDERVTTVRDALDDPRAFTQSWLDREEVAQTA